MKIYATIFLSIILIKPSAELKKLYEKEVITKNEYSIFKKQIEFKKLNNTQERIDSMKSWNLDIVYTEEKYFPKKDSFLVCEYYFNSSKIDSFENNNIIYRPDKYYENGILKNKYHFHHKDGKDHLQSILKHMKNRKIFDKIKALAKIEVLHAGCGLSYYQVDSERKKASRKYRKPKTPKYFLTETLLYKNNKTISFQKPVKQKFNVIVEGHSF